MVRTPEGGFVRSQTVHLANVTNFCNTTGIYLPKGNTLQIYPNPSQSLMHLKGNIANTTVNCYNVQAKEIFPRVQEDQDGRVYDLMDIEKGLHFLKVNAHVFKIILQ